MGIGLKKDNLIYYLNVKRGILCCEKCPALKKKADRPSLLFMKVQISNVCKCSIKLMQHKSAMQRRPIVLL